MKEEMNEMEEIGSRYDMMELFEELSFREKLRKVINGIKQPKDSGEYKYAKLQLLRLLAPVSAVVVPITAVALLALFAGMRPPLPTMVNVMIMEPEAIEELDEIEEIIEDIPEMEIEVDFTPDVAMPHESPIPTPDTDFSPQPALIDSVIMIKSPVIMKGIFGSRSPGARGAALVKYGGNPFTEDAVLRALRWLKKYQEEDGSWWGRAGGYSGKYDEFPEALTALALLTFLAHGETPGSPEFGKAVGKAIEWLIEDQGANGFYKQTGGSMGYTHPIVTYALCEAYGLTKVPAIGKTAEKALEFLLKGQNADGGWDYHCRQSARIDVSICAWCMQALKAADMAGVGDKNRVDRAMKNAKNAFTRVLFNSQEGCFKYHNQASYEGQFKPLTAAAVLSLQLMGEAKAPEAQKGLQWLEQNATCDWEKPWGPSPLYYWYYTTQVKFHTGGETWTAWNKQFAPMLVKSQTVVKGGGVDGKDIGYWEAPTSGGYDGFSYIYNTTMCALQLQVYYRYLPTFKPPEEIKLEEEVASEEDVDIDINM